MIGFLKTLLFFLFFYIIYKIVKNLIGLVSKPKPKNEPFVSSSKKSTSKIDTSDIIEADFEEIRSSGKNTSTDS